MATSYGDLENRDGTIYNKKTGKGYKDPGVLATDMGIKPHEINWGNIGAWTPPAATPPSPAATPTPSTQTSTPTTPTTPTPTAPTPTPTPTQANYSGLVNKGGTIYLGDRAFSTPQELAQHLGIQSHQIDWGQIGKATPEPTTVATSDQLRAEQADEALPYVKYADSEKVFDKEGQHITAEQAAEIPDFWNQVQMSGEARPEGLKTPMEGLQDVFGPDWTPSAAFTPELQALGIYGAVKIGDKVFTLGPGGGEESAASYKDKFGREIDDTAGIAGDVDIATALRLGITVSSETILDPVKPVDPYDMWTKFKEEGQEDVNKLRDKLFETTNALIDWMKGFGEEKAEAKEEEKEKLKMEEKSQKIADAQTAANDLQAAYDKKINDERFKGRGMIQITGRQAKLKSMKAVELAPKLIAIQIAQGNWDRAKEMLDDWSDDYNTNMEMQMQAAQMNIDMITGELNREQTEQLADAKIKFDMWQNDENRRLDTQEEVKKLMLMYNGQGAGININDNWDTAYQKASAYIENELQFERDMKDLDKKLKEKALAKPYYAPTGTIGGLTTTQLLSREKEFWNEVDAGIKILDEKGGQKWGEVWDRVKSQFPEYANEYIDQALGGSFTEGQAAGRALSKDIITKDYLRSLYTQDDLIKAAKDAGFGKLLKGGKAEAEDYLDYLMGTVDQYRKAGFSDQEILKQMQ